jgi:hypothetical protein
MLIRKQDIYQLEIEHWHTLGDEEFEQQVEMANLHNFSTWLLPQLVAHFGRWRLYSTGQETVVKNCTSALDKVLWRLSRVRRSLLVKNQTRQPEYGQLTPLILLGLKRSQGYSYEQLREFSDIKWLLEPPLMSALSVTISIPQKNRLLEIRDQGLIYRTGKNSGTRRNPETTWQLYGIQDTELGNYPKLLQTILCQCWLAHPKNRRETMILDPNNWDLMPESLIDVDVVKPVVVDKKSASGYMDVPW